MNMTKISKTMARTAWMSGDTIVIVPCKCRPDSFLACKLGGEPAEELTKENFDKLVNAFEYYNCNGETGGRAAYYM